LAISPTQLEAKIVFNTPVRVGAGLGGGHVLRFEKCVKILPKEFD
jgi:hypothetical protein